MLALEQIKTQLDSIGYYYLPGENSTVLWGTDSEAILTLGRGLGRLYVPDGVPEEKPILTTLPNTEATVQQPFDHKNTIGWHNDFSSLAKRPKYSIFSIKQQDPKGGEFGAWGVLSGQQLIEQLKEQYGEALLVDLLKPMFPFSFNCDAVAWYPLVKYETDSRILQLRYYRYAITEGLSRAQLSNEQRQKIHQLIDIVEATANQFGLKLAASNNSLLIVNNEICLHNRFEQSVTKAPRIANLLFVQ